MCVQISEHTYFLKAYTSIFKEPEGILSAAFLSRENRKVRESPHNLMHQVLCGRSSLKNSQFYATL
jgi:hypothetical protein